MVLSNPIDWTAQYGALYTWAFGVSGWTTRWADQPEARPDYPYVLLDVQQMSREGGLDEVRTTIDLTRARHIRVTPTVQNSTLYRVTINAEVHEYTSDADATAAEITAGLTSAIQAGVQPVTVTDNTGTFDIEGNGETLNPSTPGLYNVVTTTNLEWANLDEGNEVAHVACGRRVVTLNIQAFERDTRTDNPGTDPARNAFNMLSRLQASLMTPSVQTQLRASGIAIIEEGDVLDLSEPVEDTILSRASMDVRMRMLSTLTEYTGYIYTVSGDSTLTGTKSDPVNDTYSVPD